MQDRLDTLAIFVAVAEQQSFAEDARQLSRSPASVTRAVSALEERLQTRLLNRTTRSVALTDAGLRYLESCRRLLSAYDDTTDAAVSAALDGFGLTCVRSYQA